MNATDTTPARSKTESPFLTAKEAAEYLRTTRGTVYNLVWKGLLPRRRGKLLFTRDELDVYLAGRPARPR